MQINSIPPVQALGAIERHAGQAQPKPQAVGTHPESSPAAPKVFTPAPPLRPNVQDYVDIDRTLIALRRM